MSSWRAAPRRPSPPLAAPRRPSSRTPRCHAPCAPHGLRRALAAQVGTPPFEAQGHHETYKKISKVDLKFPAHISADVRADAARRPPRSAQALTAPRRPAPLQARDLISKLLVKEPSARMPLAEVASHKWIVAHCE